MCTLNVRSNREIRKNVDLNRLSFRFQQSTFSSDAGRVQYERTHENELKDI